MVLKKEDNFELIEQAGIKPGGSKEPDKELAITKRELKFDLNLEVPIEETSTERLDEVNRHFKNQLISPDGGDKERVFRMYMVTHTVLAADEGATDEALVRNFLLSKPGLMSLLQDEENLRVLYDAFENHISINRAHHLLLSPEGFVACLRRIATKANKALAKHTGKPSYLDPKG